MRRKETNGGGKKRPISCLFDLTRSPLGQSAAVEIDVVRTGVESGQEVPVCLVNLRWSLRHVRNPLKAGEDAARIVVGDAVVTASLDVDRYQVGGEEAS